MDRDDDCVVDDDWMEAGSTNGEMIDGVDEGWVIDKWWIDRPVSGLDQSRIE